MYGFDVSMEGEAHQTIYVLSKYVISVRRERSTQSVAIFEESEGVQQNKKR